MNYRDKTVVLLASDAVERAAEIMLLARYVHFRRQRTYEMGRTVAAMRRTADDAVGK